MKSTLSTNKFLIGSSAIKDEIQLGGNGVKSILSNYTVYESIAEYVWNGFDAGATKVDISYEENEFASLKNLKITDNGKGIPQELLSIKFKPFHESEKSVQNKNPRHHSLLHGKNGVGRLTFFTFANSAKWNTTYELDKVHYQYDIEIHSDDLQNYSGAHTEKSRLSSSALTSTSVVFEGIRELSSGAMQTEVKQYLLREFCWFLELFKERDFVISINNDPLDHKIMFSDKKSQMIEHKDTKTDFTVTYVHWKQKLNQEYSKYYLLNAKGEEVWKSTTLLNNRGDKFYHSVYIKSGYFDNFIYDEKEDENRQTLRNNDSKFNNQHDPEFKYLLTEFNDYLRRMRSPHLQRVADELVDRYERDKILPEIKNEWEQPRQNELKQLIKGVFQIQPKIFSDSSIEQKKTFVHLLNALLDSDQRDQIYDIVNSIVRLDPKEQRLLADLLKVTRMDSIIRTIKMINDRYITLDALKAVVFDKSLEALEPDHLQKILDHNFWVFGEQYSLVTSTEVDFEKALSEYLYILRGGTKQKITMDSQDRNKEMDLFLCRQSVDNNTIHNLIVELKRPSVLLGEEHVSQVMRYQRAIFSDHRFNGENASWDFILVGNRFNTSGYIEGEIDTNQHHGEKEKGLIFSNSKNCKIYVKKWSDVFADVACRHKFLQDKLEVRRDQLATEYESADKAVERATKK